MGDFMVFGLLAAGCDGGVNQVVNDHAQHDGVRKAEKRQAADRRAVKADAVRDAVRAKLGMPEAAASQLSVTIIPEQERLAGAKDPSTGLCVVLGLKDDAWTVFKMGTTLDPVIVKAMGNEYISGGTVGDAMNAANLGQWVAENCAPSAPRKDPE